MTAEKYFNKWNLEHYFQSGNKYQLLALMNDYSKEKCKELLEIVAENAKLIDEDGDVYEQPHTFFCNGEPYKNWVDKDSILKAIDLDKFIV